MLGTAFAVGCTVDGMKPMDFMEGIESGDIACPTESARRGQFSGIPLDGDPRKVKNSRIFGPFS